MLTRVLLNKHSTQVQSSTLCTGFHLLGVCCFSFASHNHHFKTCIKGALHILVTHNKIKVALTLYRIDRQCLLNKNQGHLGNATFTLYSLSSYLSPSDTHTSNSNCRSFSVYHTVVVLKNLSSG